MDNTLAKSPLDRLLASPIVRFGMLVGQLAVALYLITEWYELEGQAFMKLGWLLLAGFAVHFVLPKPARLPFFAILSVASLPLIFGPVQAAWLLAVGLALIGICHLPMPPLARWGVLLLAIGALALQRIGALPTPWSKAIWPILGSMFMLRLVIYHYDLQHKNAPAGFWRGVGYFFMIPNVCFPLFPVVDYQEFCRTHENDAERTRIYQSGVSWMVRGIVQLILYRVVYQYLPIDTTSVVDLASLLRFLIWPFLLYLQVSGLFHLVVGILHLFGFNLPETHHLFYLASSYTDFWRRINIYWKDFMMKVFYYPAFFKLRKQGPERALVIGTFWVFFATWFLHSWQWFWLRGQMLLKWSDTLFWTILAVLVAVNVVHESRHPAKKQLGATTRPMRESVAKAFRTFGVFASICILWSLWISDSVLDWASLFGIVGKPGASAPVAVLGLLAFAGLFVLVALWYDRRKPRPFTFWGSAVRCSVALFVLLVIGAPDFYRYLDREQADAIRKIKQGGLNSRDSARRQRDYYEKLNDVGWDNPELAKVYVERPADWGSIRYRPDLAKLDTGLPYLELIPNASGRHRGAMLQFNRLAMRDRDYPDTPAADSYRIALVGASHTFGSGVEQAQNFETLVEERLNQEGDLGDYRRVEILNCAVEAYSGLDVAADLERRVLGYHPAALVYVVHLLDAHLTVTRLASLYAGDMAVPYAAVDSLARSVGVAPKMPAATAERLLGPKKVELLTWCYRRLAEDCRAAEVKPVLVYLPILTPHGDDLTPEQVLEIAQRAGFLTISLQGVYEGRDKKSLELAPWDDHPNVLGHSLVAERLYRELRANQASLWRNHASDGDQREGTSVHPQGVPAGGGSGTAH